MRYAVVIEKGERNYSAYVPDLSGCVSVGDTLDEVKSEIRKAIAFHLGGLREDDETIPARTISAKYSIRLSLQIANLSVRIDEDSFWVDR